MFSSTMINIQKARRERRCYCSTARMENDKVFDRIVCVCVVRASHSKHIKLGYNIHTVVAIIGYIQQISISNIS